MLKLGEYVLPKNYIVFNVFCEWPFIESAGSSNSTNLFISFQEFVVK